MTRPPAGLTIDRLCLVVSDLDGAATRFASLGFTLTPQGEHMVGSRNRCVMLREGQYLELLDPHASMPDAASLAYERRLERFGEGLAVLSLRCDDLDAVAVAWRRAGLRPSPMRPYSRTADLPDGRTQARFELIQLPAPPCPGMPGLAVCACRQLTPEVVWRPDCLDHDNGATAVSSLTLPSATPERDAEVLSGLALTHWRPTPGGAELTLGGIRLRLRRTPPDAATSALNVSVALTSHRPIPSTRMYGIELSAAPGVRGPSGLTLTNRLKNVRPDGLPQP